MADLWEYVKGLFKKAEQSSPSRPLIHELIQRSEEEKTYLKARRIVSEGFASYQDTKSTLSWEQLSYIQPYEKRLESEIDGTAQKIMEEGIIAAKAKLEKHEEKDKKNLRFL